MDPYMIQQLLNEYNRDPRRFNDEEAEVIANLAKSLGRNFERENKPISKLLYSAGEMATFGMLPDSLRPHSRGQDVYGETAIDMIAGGAGSLLGLTGGAVGAYKGARGLMRSDTARNVGGKVVDAGKTFSDMTGANRAISNVRNRMPNLDGILMRTRGY